MDYDIIKQKVPDFFCIQNLRDIYKHSEYDFDISFIDFLMCIEDFYTFAYSTKLSRTSWMLFTWLRTLVRYDGYVTLSYKDVSNKFCQNKNVISKPTFFKCINELDSYGLIKKVSNKKLFDAKYQKDTNTYIVISKVDEILPLLEKLNSQAEFYNLLKNEYFTEDKTEKKQKKYVQKSENQKIYSYETVMEEYKDVKQDILDFFEFLGSANKTKKIANSRKLNILNQIMNVYPYEEDLSYAIGQTISKGVKSEKYMYAILRNLYDESKNQSVDNETDSKLKSKYANKNAYSHITDEQYEKYKDSILHKKGGYLLVYKELKSLSKLDAKEEKLLKVCEKLKQKFAHIKHYEQYRGERVGILCNYEIYEMVEYDSCWNEYISWQYENGDIVPLDVIKKIMKSNKEAFVFGKMQYIDGEVYK